MRISLINMPFSALDIPSLALTRLKAVLDAEFGARVSTEICYLNHDFAHYMGLELYQYFVLSVESLLSGVAGWFFRPAAFPELADNAEQYFQRFYPRQDERTHTFKRLVREKQQGLEGFLDELIARYDLHEAHIVGFTSMFLQDVANYALARKLKARRPEVITVVGGDSCWAPMGDAIVKHVSHIDFVFAGPALKSFPQFVGHCLEGEEAKCHCIDGVFSEQNRVRGLYQSDDDLVTTAEGDEGLYVGPVGEDLDIDTPISLDYEPFLRRHEEYFASTEVEKILLFETSRGCWWGERSKCIFCGFNDINIHYRAMSTQRAIEQITALFKYAGRCVQIRAVDPSMPKNYAKEVFAHLDTPLDLVISYGVKTDLSEDEMRLLAQGGVKGMQPGVESLATSTLKLMRKGVTAFQNLRFLKYCAMYNIYPIWSILVGFPGEDKEAAEQAYQKYVRDVPLLVHLPPPGGVYPIRFDRYSHYFCHAQEYALDLQAADFYEMTYPFDKQVLADLAYYFVDRQNFRADYFKTMAKWIDRITAQVDLWWARWHSDEQPLAPRLFLKRQGAASTVYDSRGDQVIEHPVGDVGQQVLAYLSRPCRMADLAADLRHVPDFDPQREIAWLQERGLIFEEGGRYLSLVLPQEPPPLTLPSWQARRVRKSSLAQEGGGFQPG